jgi:predicted nucleotidyltransferase
LDAVRSPAPPTPGKATNLSIIGLVLYGSRARGDYAAGSDVDLLGLTREGAPTRRTAGKVTLSCYPLEHVIGRARAGDLFAFHIVSEGRVLYEREAVFERIVGAFALRSDYSREIALASDVGWLLLHHRARVRDPRRLNERMAWCTQTMLIARAANRGLAVFSAAGLAAFAGSDDVALVIANKHAADARPQMVERFHRILTRFGGPEPPPLPTLDEERRRFEAARNAAGVIAIRAMLRSAGAQASAGERGEA